MNTITNKEYNKLKFEQLSWIEKYKPQTVDQLYISENLKSRFKYFIQNPNSMSNLILTGSHGIGKTSSIRCIGKELYGKYYENYVLELNMSDNKSSKIIQNDIINFCKLKLIYQDQDIKKYAPFKLIILDEADNIENRIQPQLASIMELYNKSVKFVFTCNTSYNLIEIIQSRCLILIYVSSNELITDKLKKIVKTENIKYDDEALEQICKLSYGDMRSSINILQLIHNMHKCIKLEYVNDIYDLPQQIIIKKLFEAIIKKNLKLSFNIINELKQKGYSGSDIVLGIIKTLRSDICNDIPENIKIDIFEIASISSYNISKSFDSTLQIYGCVCELVNKIKIE